MAMEVWWKAHKNKSMQRERNRQTRRKVKMWKTSRVAVKTPVHATMLKSFKNTSLMVLSGTDNPVPFYKCLLNGDVVMNEELCIGKGEDYINVMPAFDCERVISTIEEIADERLQFAQFLPQCVRMLAKESVRKFTKDLTRELSELGKRRNARFQWQSNLAKLGGREESELGVQGVWWL